MLDLKTIEQIQQAVLSEINFEENANQEAKSNPLFAKLLEVGRDTAFFALGKTGKKLYEVAELVDLDHPHLDGLIQESESIIEILELALVAKEKGLTKMFPIDKVKIKLQDIGISLIKDRSKVKELRASKNMQFVNMEIVSKMGSDFWESQPDNFMGFVRNSTPYQDKVLLIERKSECFKDLGCVYLAKELTKELDEFKAENLNSYYGFNKITVSSAIVIMAKILGYKMSVSDKITIPINTYREFVNILEQNGVLHFEGQKENLIYEPRIYPISDIESIPDTLNKLIEHLDKFPQINHKSLFDNYLIVIAASCPENVPGTFSFENRRKYVSEFDNLLINKKLINPIVLGEKDNKCYFLCFWN